MRKVNQALALSVLTITLATCSKKAAEIQVSLDAAALPDTSTVKQFVFIAPQAGSSCVGSTSGAGCALVFPEGCLSSSGGTTCRKSGQCGFNATLEPTFRPQLPLSADQGAIFPDGASVSLIACALGDDSATIIAGGTSTFTNQADATVTITLGIDASSKALCDSFSTTLAACP